MNIDEIAFAAVANACRHYKAAGSNGFYWFDNLILGRSGNVEAYPGAGHNAYAILKASYEYYSYDPSSNINQILYNRILYILENDELNLEKVNILMNFIYCQTQNELIGMATYKWDLRHLVDVLADCVKNKNIEGVSFDENMQKWVSEREQVISSLSK